MRMPIVVRQRRPGNRIAPLLFVAGIAACGGDGITAADSNAAAVRASAESIEIGGDSTWSYAGPNGDDAVTNVHNRLRGGIAYEKSSGTAHYIARTFATGNVSGVTTDVALSVETLTNGTGIDDCTETGGTPCVAEVANLNTWCGSGSSTVIGRSVHNAWVGVGQMPVKNLRLDRSC